MLAVSSAFPLTSDQPPLAVISPKVLASLIPGWDRPAAQRVATDRMQSTVRPENAVKSDGPGERVAASRNPFAVAGPPPSFEANILEIERQFDAILARIELARSQREMRQGGQVTLAAPQAAAAGKASPQSDPLHWLEGSSTKIARFDWLEAPQNSRSAIEDRAAATARSDEPEVSLVTLKPTHTRPDIAERDEAGTKQA